MTLSTSKANKICCVFIKPKHNWFYEVSGFFGKYKFFADIQDRKSVVGINGGPVIVLTVWRMSKTLKRISRTINFIRETEKMSYNRGWIMYPQTKKETYVLSVILHCLRRRCW